MSRILVTPLDWGLGHASRCIPIINNLLGRGFEVILAGSGDSIELLKVEFPKLNTFTLPGYKPEYSKSGAMIWKMLLQLPKFTAVMRKEHKALEEIVKREHIDLVISDNRYGCWSVKVPSVFITHQTNIQLPPSLKWFSRFVRLYNTRAINRFAQCWIPDNPGSHSLTGKLVKRRNHGIRKLIYIGNISRFEHAEPIPATYDVLFILSGPEPQRTIFENIVLREALTSGLKYFIVRGVPLPDSPLHPGVKHADFLPTAELQSLISKSSCVIARSGYSTIMDLAKLGKKAIFIPTPGQTEQEYLANRMMKMGITYTTDQQSFDLRNAWKASKDFPGFHFTRDRFELLDDTLSTILPTLLAHAAT